jgi:hypothetical protein
MSDEANPVLAMCWYDETQWNILKQREPNALDATYETWRKNATRALQEMAAAGHKIQKVAIKIDAFLRWCDEHGVDPNAESRSAYAAWKLQHRGN